MRKLIVFILSMLLGFSVLPLSADAAESGHFSDTAGHWAEDAINEAVAKGYVSGYPEGSFRPDQTVTRAEFIRMLADALRLPHAQKGSPWYQPYVAALLEAGIHKHKDFKANYDLPLTRMEMARLAVRAADTTLATEDAISDAQLMYEATKQGIIHGMGKGELAPEGHSTRAQAVAIIERVLAVHAGKTIPTDKYAMSAAELAWRHTNMETVFGLTRPAKLPMKILESPIHVTVEKLIVIDWEDPDALYRSMFPPLMNTRDGSIPDKDYIVALQLTFKNDTPRQGMYNFHSKFMPSLPYSKVAILEETEQVRNVPIVRLEKEFEETYWYLLVVSKEKADSLRAKNGLGLYIGRDSDVDLRFSLR